MSVNLAKDDVLSGVGLYMLGYYIQLSKREFTDKETGEIKVKRYLMMAAGDSTRGGAVNIAVSEEEYSALGESELYPGVMLLAPVEAFAFKDKAYFRAIGPVSLVSGGNA